MSRESENIMLLLVGVAVAMITFTGAFTRYVKASLLPWLLIAAVVLITLALTAIIGDIRRGGSSLGGHDDHVHRRGIVWLLLIPIVVLIFVVPPALRPQAAAPSVTSVSTDVLRRAFPPLPAGVAPEISIPEVMIRALQDTAGTLDNRLITVTGFTMKAGDGVDLGRIVIICCAADAQLARLHVAGPAAAAAARYPDYTWLRMQGTVTSAPAHGDTRVVPTLNAIVATQVDPPANSYANPYRG